MCAVIIYEDKNSIKLVWNLLKLLKRHNKIFLIERDIAKDSGSLKENFNGMENVAFYSFDGEKLKDVEIL